MKRTFEEQWERVKRMLARVDDHNRDSFSYDDDLWSFFQNCWHLKDWIKNDEAVPKAVRDGIETKVANVESIMICADLANRSKHLQLVRNIRRDADVTNRSVTIRVGHACGVESGAVCTSESEHIITLSDGRKFVAQLLAHGAVEDWRKLLRGLGLI